MSQHVIHFIDFSRNYINWCTQWIFELSSSIEEKHFLRLSGKAEVPPTDSSATGWAKFQTNENGTQVSYWINLTGMKEITGAHIRNGSATQNGDVVIGLSGQKSAQNGNNTTISFSGNITPNDLQGPLKGKELSELVGLMSNGVVYVNIHSGEFQNGEIRGQIASGLPEAKINMTSTSNTTTTINSTIPN